VWTSKLWSQYSLVQLVNKDKWDLDVQCFLSGSIRWNNL